MYTIYYILKFMNTYKNKTPTTKLNNHKNKLNVSINRPTLVA